jgi:tetratricopeptide (TPR) repeat protein
MTPGLLGRLLSRGPGEQTVAELDAAVEQQLASDEQVHHRLPARGAIAHQQNGERGSLGADGALAVVTGHRVLFVADGGDTVVDLPHTDIRGAALDGGLFSTVIAVESREAGSYRLQPAGDDAAAAVDYIAAASDCWQFVETLLEELEGHAERIRTAIEQREFERVTEVLDEAEETTDELDERVAAAGLEDALGDRVERARRNLQRTRVRTRRELARARVTEAEARHLDGETDYAGAAERYERAHEHLSTAHAIARDHGLETGEIEAALGGLAERAGGLANQPVGLAKQATERALCTDDPAVRVETTQAALEHYHDAMAVGWGTGLDRPYDREELRFRIALLADGLVEARREYARRLEADGDALAEWGDDERARERLRAAVEQLDAAVDTAREFRVPDAGPVERERSRLARRRDEG